VGSFVDARSCGGRWLLRMEDLDAARVIPGCADEMLHTLEALACTGTAPSSTRAPAQNTTRARSRLSPLSPHFPVQLLAPRAHASRALSGTCADGPRRRGPTATRFRVEDRVVSFADRAQGVCRFPLGERGMSSSTPGRRVRTTSWRGGGRCAAGRDRCGARRADLLDSTPWQLALQGALQLPTPRYAPPALITEPVAAKLAKSRRSVALDPAQRGASCRKPSPCWAGTSVTLKFESPQTVLDWACAHWDLDRFQGVRQVRATPAGHS